MIGVYSELSSVPTTVCSLIGSRSEEAEASHGNLLHTLYEKIDDDLKLCDMTVLRMGQRRLRVGFSSFRNDRNNTYCEPLCSEKNTRRAFL
jgi:hypothetical protein